ncbi:PREDICTED: uncharacterized protein LOC104606506 [Nelumbo nucifera]|uniref:Uncharacterized protein LOC104606506 n=1 Tax=Nelumbo nucifera TaxID=4432 RepID=A0A1U8Q7V6_NELNU|nr:PREDICTED: uncharacterized protein LOC104606506 [Nelumbo nucifera]XP_019054857.1 PREDICTED: uncharacterized protein LOC104606506 [Nelumbo nucifera]XP_019054858.1 PREDICTED: uncharacterized protein LOC104606506 [Nelumbo nucifera]
MLHTKYIGVARMMKILFLAFDPREVAYSLMTWKVRASKTPQNRRGQESWCIHTLADLNHSSSLSFNDDSDGPQEYYIGGEKRYLQAHVPVTMVVSAESDDNEKNDHKDRVQKTFRNLLEGCNGDLPHRKVRLQ